MIRQEKKRIVFLKYFEYSTSKIRSETILNDEKPAVDSLS